MKTTAALLSLAVLISLVPRVEAASEETRVSVWTRWEHHLISSKSYANPFADPVVSVRYQGPGNESIAAFGFWDGEATFKIRCMFPTPGKWSWRTSCSDPANRDLHNQTGMVEAVPYDGGNPLYRKGYLRVEPGRRYLSHRDGSPFLWIGDTAWAAPMNASFAEWQTYVNDRREKHFTVLQIFCASEWAGTKDVLGNSPFRGDGLSPWNPAYWQEYEKKVQYANEQGLVVTIMGLMEPVKRYPEVADAQRFARNLAARLLGNFVIFSPSFDSRYRDLADSVASSVREAAPFHLITQHPGTHLPTARLYHGKPPGDFSGLQTGAGWGSKPVSPVTASRNAIEWTQELYRLPPPKPVINLEARYDSAFNQEQSARLPRSCGYLTFLSGAAGYTYGCAGIWNWGQGFVGKDPQASPWQWQKGLEQHSSLEMKFMAEFFGGLDWWRLEPCHELIRNQPEDWLRRMVMAKAARNDLAVAYLPDNPVIAINMQPFPKTMRIHWFNPKTGEKVSRSEMTSNSGDVSFERPAGWDDALLVLSAARP